MFERKMEERRGRSTYRREEVEENEIEEEKEEEVEEKVRFFDGGL